MCVGVLSDVETKRFERLALENRRARQRCSRYVVFRKQNDRRWSKSAHGKNADEVSAAGRRLRLAAGPERCGTGDAFVEMRLARITDRRAASFRRHLARREKNGGGDQCKIREIGGTARRSDHVGTDLVQIDHNGRIGPTENPCQRQHGRKGARAQLHWWSPMRTSRPPSARIAASADPEANILVRIVRRR